jgi:glycine/D-amino acid oxidase-like deaminating enzyme
MPLRAGTVVVAAGVGTPTLCASAGLDIPVSPSPALLFTFRAPRGLIKTVVSGSGVEVRQCGDVVLAAGAYDGERNRREVEQTARRTGARIASTFRGAEDIDLLTARVGIRPMPADGQPIIGLTDVRGVYLSVMHSGVTLAAAVGRLTADELIGGRPPHALVNCRLARFGVGISQH